MIFLQILGAAVLLALVVLGIRYVWSWARAANKPSDPKDPRP